MKSSVFHNQSATEAQPLVNFKSVIQTGQSGARILD